MIRSALILLLTAAPAAIAAAPNDFYYPNSWHHQQIGSEAAWSINPGSPSIIVAVVDNGVDATHPDLAGHIVPGWNFNTNTPETSPTYWAGQPAWHGTAVAGVIAATRNNGIGIAGIANVSIMPIIASDNPNGMSDSDAVLGIHYAADHGAKVINISAGLLQGQLLGDAAKYAWDKGSLVVISTANEDTITGKPAWNEVVTVSASDQDDNRYNSEFGRFLDLLAPGVGIYTTYWEPSGAHNYAIAQGSSFAAPMVSGAAALAWSINPDLTVMQVRDLLFSTAHDLDTPGKDLNTGWGRLDLAALAQAAQNTVPEPSLALLSLLTLPLFLNRRRPQPLS